jgi:hypothetical protein
MKDRILCVGLWRYQFDARGRPRCKQVENRPCGMGLRSQNLTMPEEINRILVDHLLTLIVSASRDGLARCLCTSGPVV